MVSKKVQKFIEEYIEFMEQKNWQIIYIDIDSDICGEFTKLMLDLHIDPLVNMLEIPDDFLRCQKGVTGFAIPPQVTSIRNNAFFRTGLRFIDIPENITQICSSAFEDCEDLETVILPKTIKQIQHYAFSGCTHLKTIKCNGTMAEFMSGLVVSSVAFENCKTHTIHCSDGDLTELNGNIYSLEEL